MFRSSKVKRGPLTASGPWEMPAAMIQRIGEHPSVRQRGMQELGITEVSNVYWDCAYRLNVIVKSHKIRVRLDQPV